MALRGEGAKWQFTDQSVTLEILYERKRKEGMIFVTCWSRHTCPSTTHDVILSVHDVVCFCFLCINIYFIWLRCILSFYLILCIYEFWIADMFFYYIILAKKKRRYPEIYIFLDRVAYNGFYLSWKTFMLLSTQCIRPVICSATR